MLPGNHGHPSLPEHWVRCGAGQGCPCGVRGRIPQQYGAAGRGELSAAASPGLPLAGLCAVLPSCLLRALLGKINK